MRVAVAFAAAVGVTLDCVWTNQVCSSQPPLFFFSTRKCPVLHAHTHTQTLLITHLPLSMLFFFSTCRCTVWSALYLASLSCGTPHSRARCLCGSKAPCARASDTRTCLPPRQQQQCSLVRTACAPQTQLLHLPPPPPLHLRFCVETSLSFFCMRLNGPTFFFHLCCAVLCRFVAVGHGLLVHFAPRGYAAIVQATVLPFAGPKATAEVHLVWILFFLLERERVCVCVCVYTCV